MLIPLVNSAWFWGLMGSLVFTGILLIHHFYGPGPDTHDEHGKKTKVDPEYRTFVVVELIVMISTMLVFASLAINQLRSTVSDSGALMQIAAGYTVLWIINLWDLIVIDWALVIRFRPKSIELPDTVYYTSMKPHFLGWLAGHLYMLPIAGIAYPISLLY